MGMDELTGTIQNIIKPGKGILAADESVPTITKRFQALNIESTEESRRAYRTLLFTTKGAEEFLSGVILFEETLKQKSAAGVPLPTLLTAQGMVPGIKVDKGTVPLPRFPGDKLTQGLDGLADRLTEYKKLGARFAKWRAVIRVSEQLPSDTCLWVNAHALARGARRLRVPERSQARERRG